ncbi:MAG: PadR family transcriptional regulator [Hungatella sp.]|jgi:DNA-binding PadR family transcriptional regulator|nr:PadR family transcriptional regulator [Hungatella sp.]
MAREQFQSLSEQMYYILLALWDVQCGADISRRVDQLSQGRIRIGPGTLYTLLGRFQEQEMIRETQSAGRKRYYVITEKGKRMMYTEYVRLQTLIQDGAPYLGAEKAKETGIKGGL